MNPNLRIASIVSLWSVVLLPLEAAGQAKPDTVGILVEAAHTAVDSMAAGRTVFLDPQPEFPAGSAARLGFDALQGAGFEVYEAPGIPPSHVWLLSTGEIREGKDGTEVYARLMAFGPKDEFLNAYTYVMTFRVECGEGGCVLGHWLSQGHGDGHMSPDCWGDFFSRSRQDRERCRGRHPKR